MATIRKNAVQILDENRGETSILDYHNSQKESDPNYYNWLFEGDNENIGDFGTGLTRAQSEAAEKFDGYIEGLNDVRENYEL